MLELYLNKIQMCITFSLSLFRNPTMIMPKGNGRIPKAKSVQPATTKLESYFIKLPLNYN